MRPVGEIRQALMQAAYELASGGRGATLTEIADRACVGKQAARVHVPNMKRAGALCISGERQVEYRNRPVAEYMPGALSTAATGSGWVDLGHCMADWVR